MTALARQRLDVQAFLALYEGREGKWELFDGVAVGPDAANLSAERARHTSAKGRSYMALDAAVRRSGLKCEAFTEGLTLRIRDDRAFVPDALVVCPPPPPDAIVIDNPLIVVEVLSSATAAVDHGIKLEGYFSLPSLAHYLILDADRRVVIHYRRGQAGVIETRVLSGGELQLAPPGLDLRLEDLFGPPDEATA